MDNQYDVIIVGAGLSGIGAAYYLQKHCPGMSYAILEARQSMGGTWDLFRYPGIRSDSDMYTLGHSFRPWKESQAIADGPAILKYIKETAAEFAIDSKILFQHKITKASWTDSQKSWQLSVEQGEHHKTILLNCQFLFMCSGYYNYDQGFTPPFAGREQFKGQFIHPQKWPENLNYRDKKIVVIGSGATAITLLPELAKQAQQVVMLQRSPTYVVNLPRIDAIAENIKKILPHQLAHNLIRAKNILISAGFYQFCRRFPAAAKKLILKQIKHFLPNDQSAINNFTPRYQPWDQRLCFVPDNDLFLALRAQKAKIITDEVAHFISDGIKLKSGNHLQADIIVCATGLEIKFLAGIEIKINNQILDLTQTIPYKSCMLSGVPNFAMAFGYVNASWTLKCGLICEWVARQLAYMHKNNVQIMMPEKSPKIKTIALISLNSGFLLRAKNMMPKQGEKSPWKTHQNYFLDYWDFKVRPLADRGLIYKK